MATCYPAGMAAEERLSTMNVSLPDELHRSAERRAGARHFASLSEYVRHLIREDLLQEKEEVAVGALVQSLSGKRVDRDTVQRAMQEMTKLRQSVNARGKGMSLDQIHSAIDDGRK